jgi:hypothetical protein
VTNPPGWPPDLPPADSDEFADHVVGWLLDRAPGGWRRHGVLRAQPFALAVLVRQHSNAVLDGLRGSYAAARRELADRLSPDQLDDVLVALEAEGAEAAESSRQVHLVEEALAGKRWRARL